MFKLLKGGHILAPYDMGKKDILLAYGRICKIEDEIATEGLWGVEVYDCRERILCPGFIDQHVHITGGGGEQGPSSRVPELMLGEVLSAGVTTLVGVLGVDDITRSVANVLAKARALESEGLTTYIYTGSYRIPTATITGNVATDLVFVDKVIGVGEIAISDYRSSQPTVDVLKRLAADTMAGGLAGGKAGVLHIHVGNGKEGLLPLFSLVDECDLPVDMLVPTHLNRNRPVLFQALEYGKAGGRIDLTAGESSETGFSVPDALELLLGNGVPAENITVSSDGNGSMPAGDGSGTGVGRVEQLFYDIKGAIRIKGLDAETVLKTVTSNVAGLLKLFPRKGILQVDSDADILVLFEDSFDIDKIFARGEILADNGVKLRKGFFE